jgi:tRNA (guanine37-N1)-methyltransferase
VVLFLASFVRLLPVFPPPPASLEEESFTAGLLEYPHYTRPQTWQGRTVPPVLVSGHHEEIRRWRLAEAERTTRARRRDLWTQYLARKNRVEHKIGDAS